MLKVKRRRALAAAIFAGAVIGVQDASWSKELTEAASPDSLAQQIVSQSKLSHETRAYYLLQLAAAYVAEKDCADVERSFAGSYGREITFRMDNMVESFAQQLALRKHVAPALTRGSDRYEHATAALIKATSQVEQCSNVFQKLNMQFICSRLWKELGNDEEVKKCDEAIEWSIGACQFATLPDEEHVRAVTSVLNSQSMSVLPVVIPVLERGKLIKFSEAVSDEKFKHAEDLRLRALTIGDRLSAQSDTRRRLHRDMYFWYELLSREQMATGQKEKLFELVGRHDERMLYPYGGSCGHVSWWTAPPGETDRVLCGMG